MHIIIVTVVFHVWRMYNNAWTQLDVLTQCDIQLPSSCFVYFPGLCRKLPLNQEILKSTWTMGRSLSSNLYSGCGNKSLRLYSKIRYFMVLLRKYPHLAKAPLCLDIYQKKLLSSPLHSLSRTRKYAIKKTSCSDTSYCPQSLLRGSTKDTKTLFVRTYSSSSRSSFKAEAPIGIMEESKKSSLNLSSLGGRLGQSFYQLSRHVNIYFRQKKDIAPFEENACLVVTAPDYVGRARGRTKTSQGPDKTQTLEGGEMSGTPPPMQGNWRPQLFHISALTTTFGESYSYVSHHINSVFSRGSAAVQGQDDTGTMVKPQTTHRRNKKRKTQSTYIMNSTDDTGGRAKLAADQAPMESKTSSSSWEDGFRQFARHVNTYFGAKVMDEVRQNERRTENTAPARPASLNTCAASQPKQDEQVSPGTMSLFHSSHNTTGFGENHFQMASHINQYFNGQSDLDEDQDGDALTEPHPGVPTPPKITSFMDILRHPTSAIPDLLGSYIKRSHTAKAQPTMTPPGATLSPNVSWSHRNIVFVNSQQHSASWLRLVNAFHSARWVKGGQGKWRAHWSAVSHKLRQERPWPPAWRLSMSTSSATRRAKPFCGRFVGRKAIMITIKHFNVESRHTKPGCVFYRRGPQPLCWGSDESTGTSRGFRALWEKP